MNSISKLIKIGENSFICNQTIKQHIKIHTSLENIWHIAFKVLYVFSKVYGALYILKNFLKAKLKYSISQNNVSKSPCPYNVLTDKINKILHINVNVFSINSLGLYSYFVGNQNF